jgi:hypothetical protein
MTNFYVEQIFTSKWTVISEIGRRKLVYTDIHFEIKEIWEQVRVL